MLETYKGTDKDGNVVYVIRSNDTRLCRDVEDYLADLAEREGGTVDMNGMGSKSFDVFVDEYDYDEYDDDDTEDVQDGGDPYSNLDAIKELNDKLDDMLAKRKKNNSRRKKK